MADRVVIDRQAKDHRLNIGLNVVSTDHFELFDSKALSIGVNFYQRSFYLNLSIRICDVAAARLFMQEIALAPAAGARRPIIFKDIGKIKRLYQFRTSKNV